MLDWILFFLLLTLNLLPTLMKLSFPAFCFTSLLLLEFSNSSRTKRSLDSLTRHSRDMCRASLFFSTNLVWRRNISAWTGRSVRVSSFLIRLLNCRRKNLYTILWLESLRSYARYVFKTLISMMARFHVKSWVFCGRVIREKKWFILKTPQCVLVTHRLVAHGSCKVPDDKSFIVPHVPVDGQLRLPGYLQDTHTHTWSRVETHTLKLCRLSRVHACFPFTMEN